MGMKRFGSVWAVVGDRGETHLFLRVGDGEEQKISMPGYGYKSFVQFGRTHEANRFNHAHFRKRNAESQEKEILGWPQVKQLRVSEIDFDILVEQDDHPNPTNMDGGGRRRGSENTLLEVCLVSSTRNADSVLWQER